MDINNELKENYPSRAFYEKMGGKVLKTEKITFGNKEYEETEFHYKISITYPLFRK